MMKNAKKMTLKERLKGEFEYPLLLLLVMVVICTFAVLDDNTFNAYVAPLEVIAGIFCLIFLFINRKKLVFQNYIAFLLIYMLICIGSSLHVSLSSSYFWDYAEQYFFTTVAAIYFITPWKEHSRVKEINIRYAQYGIILATLIVDVLSLIKGGNAGITIHKNILGMINVVSFMIALNDLEKKRDLFIFLPVMILNLFMAFYSSSRTSALVMAMLLSFLIIRFLFQNRKGTKKKLLFLTAVIFVLSVVLYFTRESWISYLLKGEDLSGYDIDDLLNIATSERWDIWTKQFPVMMKGNWLFGNGIFTMFETSWRKQVFLSSPVEEVAYLHNILMDAFFSGGIVGFIFFLLFFIFLYLYIRKVLKRDPIRMITLSAVLLYLMFDVRFITQPYFVNFYFFMEMSLLLNRRFRRR